MSKIFVDQVDPKTATTLTLGTSGDTVDIPTGVGLSVTDEVKTNKISPATGTAFALGDSGDTFTVPSGATIVNSGTATGFGGGLVLQTQQATSTSRTVITSTSYTGAGVTDTITCASTSSKVLVIISAQFGADSNNAATTYVGAKFQLTNNHSGISETSLVETSYQHNRPEDSGMDMIFHSTCSMVYIDSPSTTNELTYNLNGAVYQATSTLEVTSGGSGDWDKTIILIELSE